MTDQPTNTQDEQRDTHDASDASDASDAPISLRRQGNVRLTEGGFPTNFAWGTATAAYQIEGAPRADGKGESIWDRFTHTPGTIADGSNGDYACDHYHRWPEDLDLMARLGLNAYRFSISWPRIFPGGYGQVNLPGLDFYERLVDGLLERGIAPYMTLYHWDLPQALEDRGGWRNRDTANAFADYAQVMARRLGDRVGHWITHNEPVVTVAEGHINGTHAPGLRDEALALPVTHHLLLSHGLATQAIRSEVGDTVDVGITLNLAVVEPATDRSEDVEAAQRLDLLWNRMFLDPVLRGAYPTDMLDASVTAGSADPDALFRPGDMATIATPIDFLGVNYYTRMLARASKTPTLIPEYAPPRVPKREQTVMGWEVYPEGLERVLLRLRDEYKSPTIYITESGVAFPDTLGPDGKVHDQRRTEYLRDHLLATRRAIGAGVPVAGYFVWSLLDNFEWAKGFVPRFGVIYTNYPTQGRIVKDSGRYLAEVAQTGGARLDEDRL
ncbi:MAG TPA: GH1 family beta-glucosidase [Ktedonobacterales bacterium]|nr:GH1 family beta-glucosidase [Ktedonobacterales bacterium]